MVPELNSSKRKKTVLLLEDDFFPTYYKAGAYSPMKGYGVPSNAVKPINANPFYFECNCAQLTFLTTNGRDVKSQCGVSAGAIDKRTTNSTVRYREMKGDAKTRIH